MSTRFYPNGIGGKLGDTLALCRPLQTSGNVWYVNSVGGVDAASPAGQNREKPLATTSQAITNASAGDIIVYLSTHTETFTATKVVNKTLLFVGEGSSVGKPTVSLLMNAAATALFNVTAVGCEFRNIYFPANAQSNTLARIGVNAAVCRVRGCYFDCGPTDQGPAVSIGADQCRIESCTFISTAVVVVAQPLSAIGSGGGATLNDCEITNTIVSAGTVGFSNYSAVDLTGVPGCARLKVENLQLLLGADMDLGAGATVTGLVNVQTATGGSRVNWS